MIDLDSLDFRKGGGTLPVVVQDAIDGKVRMLAYADREALEATLATGVMHFRSRTRGPWRKGATSGNELRVRSLHPDCDRDALVAVVDPVGPTCHTGDESCFGADGGSALDRLAEVLRARSDAVRSGGDVSSSYTARLLSDPNLRLKKLGEELTELVAALVREDRANATTEAADLLYHVFTALIALGVTPRDVLCVLDARRATRSTSSRG